MANKKKRCKFCRDYFPADSMIKVPAGTFCCDVCMFAWLRAMRARDAKKAHTAKKKKFYSNDRSTQLRLAQKAFNAFIRERDKNGFCISCGRNHRGQYHAGHYRSIGAAPHLRFNQFNVNKQCAPCNNHKSGNIGEYRINLVAKFGLEKVEWLESQNEPVKLTIDDILSIKIYYTQLLKRIQEV